MVAVRTKGLRVLAHDAEDDDERGQELLAPGVRLDDAVRGREGGTSTD